MAARILELNELLDARRVDISNYESRIESLAAENASLEISIAEWRAELESDEARLSAVLARRGEVGESAGAIESALRSSRQQLANLQDQRSRIEVKSAQTENAERKHSPTMSPSATKSTSKPSSPTPTLLS
jgi:chromosome segregation ATPase